MLEAESEQLQAALLLTFTIFLVSLEDISTDALAIKELQCPKLVSLLQSLFQQLGIVFGSIIFLKLISVEFGTALGLEGAIISKQTFFRFVAVVFIASVVFIHLLFKEKSKHHYIHRQPEGKRWKWASFTNNQSLSALCQLKVLRCTPMYHIPDSGSWTQLFPLWIYHWVDKEWIPKGVTIPHLELMHNPFLHCKLPALKGHANSWPVSNVSLCIRWKVLSVSPDIPYQFPSIDVLKPIV